MKNFLLYGLGIIIILVGAGITYFALQHTEKSVYTTKQVEQQLDASGSRNNSSQVKVVKATCIEHAINDFYCSVRLRVPDTGQSFIDHIEVRYDKKGNARVREIAPPSDGLSV